MAGNDGLPPGWEMSVDPNTGREFYINHNTMQTSWTPPVEEPLPAGWEQQRDAEGRIFFTNHVTQVTQWEDPRLQFDDASGGNVSYPTLGPSGDGVAESSSNEWNCPSCTFANPNGSNTCEMCGTSRDGSTSSATTTPAAASNVGVSEPYGGDIDPATAAAIAAAQAEDQALASGGSGADSGSMRKVVTDPWDLEPYMVPDEHSLICTLCAKPFDWKNRRHHCKCSGTLLCHDCSSRKVKLTYDGAKETEQRVCDLCYDHLGAGDKNCYLRYIGILRDAGSSRKDDRMLALRGIADMIDKLPESVQETASIEQQASAMRTLDVVQRCGGAATLCELLNPNDPADVQIQACRIIGSMAAAAACSSFDSEAALSRSSVCNQLSDGSEAMSAIEVMLSRPNTPWEAHMHLAHALYLLGDLFEIQEAARTMRLLPPLCEFLLASQEDLQSWSTMAISRLIAGNANNIEAMLEANGMQALVLLLASSNIGIQEHAANAICSGLEVEEKDFSGQGARLASRVRDAMVNFGGATAAVGLLRSENPIIARAGLNLLRYLSGGQAEVVRAAGAVPLVVALLASQDRECQARAAQLLRNIALGSAAGSNDVLASGGLSMSLPLLSGQVDPQTQANAAALCEAFASEPQGAQIILESGACPALVLLVRNPENAIRAPAAGALVQMLQCGPQEKQAVVNAGGVEALLGLENSSDPAVLRQLIGAMYSFVSDEALLQSLTRRIAPPTLAMKLLGMLGGKTGVILDYPTMEMVLLVVAVLCGARDGDQLKDGEMEQATDLSQDQKAQLAQEQQTKDLVASNGTALVLPILSSAQQHPALVLAAFRVLLSVCSSAVAAERVAKAGGIPFVVRALDDSLNVEGQSTDGDHLVMQLRLYGINLFGRLCGGASSRGGSLANVSADDVRYGVRAITKVLDHQPAHGSAEDKLAIQLIAVRALRNLSYHSANWEAIVSVSLPQLIEILLATDSQPSLLTDISLIISNLAKLEKHCDTVLDAGAVFGLLGLLSEMESAAVESGLSTLCALAESSRRCRVAMVDQGAASKLLHIAEQRPQPLSTQALRCMTLLAQDPANAAKLTTEQGTTDTLLRLMKSSDEQVAQLALEILLAVAKDSSTLWEQLVINADIDSSIALLRLGPPRVQAQACSTIAALCGDSPGYALCASPTILEILPAIVKLLVPPEHLGSDKSESPAKEAAATCALLCHAPAARDGLIQSGVIPALVTLLLRERRLGRPRSATSEHTLAALFSFSQGGGQDDEEEEKKDTCYLWNEIQSLGKRRDIIDAITTVLDAHVRDTSPTPSGCDRAELCEQAIVLIGKLPENLSPNEVTLLGRSSRSLNLVMNEASPPESLVSACLDTLARLGKQKGQTQMLIASGTIRSAATLLEPLTLESSELGVPLNPNNILKAAGLIASLVKDSKDRSVDDAVMGTKTVAALAALLTRSSELFPSEVLAARALTAGLEAISSLAQGGVGVQKAIMATDNVLPALAKVVSLFDQHDAVSSIEEHQVDIKRATDALLTLSHLATLDEHRVLIVNSDPSILEICHSVLLKQDNEYTAYNELIFATVCLLCDLGPSVVAAIPDIVPELSNSVFVSAAENQHDKPELFKQTMRALTMFSMDFGITQTSLSSSQFTSLLCGVIKDTKTPNPVKDDATTILVSLASIQAVRDNADQREELTGACLQVLSQPITGDTKVQLTNCLLALNNLTLSSETRQSIRKNLGLVRAIRSIGTSADTDMYASHLAARLFACLGIGEVLVRKKAVKPTIPAPIVNGTAPNGHINSKVHVPPSVHHPKPPQMPATHTSVPLPKQPKTSPLLSATKQPAPPQMPLLPTYSSTVNANSIRQAPPSRHSGTTSQTDLASLELARKLQAEENRKQQQQTAKRAPPPSTKWNCGTCTFENEASATKCEMCQKPKPQSSMPTPPTYESTSSSASSTNMIHVRCPKCRTTLAAPSTAQMFQCMQCNTTSSTMMNRA
mmetsp:Transcript_27167/g.43652  ORF Transcript_27167/g.43652 Transcript_27167/m.43652 type:complete len:1980 (+) Transcript_27167:563-6502(+)|eukprot:CAMPEP_0203747152 /NCGR_PEP_ID=MMETSP0098-20131031/2387_1 /ASSEMBLY_ACC=CAM_ASM_000208 /TAXON_ID=96639 /ORGANISM=" , Strain NY0313808BC1" /LENGTH=1979 /DNA_ID=CAMNT_0050635501 /DNA_START=365 /DNA_END=6304 /DNA_ORIENTATION=+